MAELNLKAMAKVNLGLDVLRKREDGYHDLRMIMQSVYLYDKITLRESAKPGITVRTNLSYLPVNQNNLVYKAAQLLMEEFGITTGLEIRLKKYIPVAAGLAGGSSDAAAVLVGVNRMFHLGLSQKELMQRGVKIGADVPYCILRGTALAEGIGEVLTPLPDAPDAWVLLAKPPIHVSTAFVYGNLKADQITEHPDIDRQKQAIEQGDLYEMAARMGNVLEQVTIPAYPVIDEIKDVMKRSGAIEAMMSGSGPTVFGLFDNKEQAKAAGEQIEQAGLAKQVFLTRFFHRTGKGAKKRTAR
jgi:4-diphosphocytidyl-2-C-methyl-D-erythritol kinase